MSRTLLLAVLLAISTAAFAAKTGPDGSASVSAAFGNTIVSTYPDGRTGELWLAPGGTYTAEGRRGDHSRGHWSVKGEKLCLKQSHPIPIPFSFCTPIPRTGLGQAWAAKAQTGEAISVKVVKGHVAGKAQARTNQPPPTGG